MALETYNWRNWNWDPIVVRFMHSFFALWWLTSIDIGIHRFVYILHKGESHKSILERHILHFIFFFSSHLLNSVARCCLVLLGIHSTRLHSGEEKETILHIFFYIIRLYSFHFYSLLCVRCMSSVIERTMSAFLDNSFTHHCVRDAISVTTRARVRESRFSSPFCYSNQRQRGYFVFFFPEFFFDESRAKYKKCEDVKEKSPKVTTLLSSASPPLLTELNAMRAERSGRKEMRDGRSWAKNKQAHCAKDFSQNSFDCSWIKDGLWVRGTEPAIRHDSFARQLSRQLTCASLYFCANYFLSVSSIHLHRIELSAIVSQSGPIFSILKCW